MCGVAGYADFGRVESDAATVRRMLRSMRHRGPDESGTHADGPVTLGLRRLSIVDRTTTNIVHANEDGTVVSVCNGEIFNHGAIRRNLASQGCRLRSVADTEVIPYLYARHGLDFVQHLHGQFALALFDKSRRRLVLARDHLGVLPLFFAEPRPGLHIFGSEIKAVLAHPAMEAKVNLSGLDQILSLPGLVSPTTMFAGVHALKPGEMLVADPSGATRHIYWDVDYPEMAPEDDRAFWGDRFDAELAERGEELAGLLTRGVSRRLADEVETGCYLSGGLDSSLIFQLAKDVRGAPLQSFGVVFDDPALCEAHAQRVVAGASGRHQHIRVTEAGLIARLEDVVVHSEAPVKETYNSAALSLAENARKRGCSVVLAGEGADELFGGYPGYLLAGWNSEEADGSLLQTEFERQARGRMWGLPDLRYETGEWALRALREDIYHTELRPFIARFEVGSQTLLDVEKLRGRHPVQQRSYMDLKLRLADHLLGDHGDRMCLAHSLECRYPFLDRDVVEFARRTPACFKVSEGHRKRVVYAAAAGRLPKAITEREKFGFRAATSAELLQNGSELLQDLLSTARVRRQGYFDPDVIEALKDCYSEPGFRLHPHLEIDLLLVAASFSLWLEIFNLPCR